MNKLLMGEEGRNGRDKGSREMNKLSKQRQNKMYVMVFAVLGIDS